MSEGPRILLTGGGTGGHIYPALAVVEVLGLEAVAGYVGSPRGLEARVVPDAGLELVTLETSGVMGKSVSGKLRGAARAARAVGRARQILRDRRPDAVLGTGGYVTGPVGVAAWLEGIPLIILEENAIPGVTNRLLGHVAHRVAVPWEEAREGFPASVRPRVVVTGNPVRTRVLAVSREEARRELGLPARSRTVLLFGGSQGAAELNRVGRMLAQSGSLPEDTFLVWASGVRYFEEVSRALGDRASSRVRLVPYLDDMPAALAVADLAVTRAGAVTLAELTARGVPSILIPSPNVTSDHQTANARVLARRGAARLVTEDSLRQVRPIVRDLLDRPETLKEMAQAAEALGRPDAARKLADLVLKAAEMGRKRWKAKNRPDGRVRSPRTGGRYGRI